MAGLRVAIVGSGFAGSILARILHRQGHEVALVDRGTHPRFALGESSTPLAAICLERLAARYSLEDLHDLAAYGRWMRHLPRVRRGLKRGFTFYAHRPGQPFRNSERNEHRLLVAASPADAVADAHWLRSDVDHFLVSQAEQAGVPFFDETELEAPEWRPDGVRLAGRRRGTPWSFMADLVIDASGAGRFLARHLPIPSQLRRMRLRTGLVYSHFDGARPFAEVSAETGAELPAGPYPDERAAVHHLLPEGWLYVLPFDDGTVSAGFVLEWSAARRFLASPPESAWRDLLTRYPTLNQQFGDARPTRPIATIPRLQRRLACAAGPNWALLPHAFAFLSPLFSTGIAWSLVAVERLALVLEDESPRGRNRGLAADLARYGRLLDAEATHLTRLVERAYQARHDFDVFVAYSFLYFALASFAEAAQRLLPERRGGDAWGWSGFLGADDPVAVEMVRRAGALLGAASRVRAGKRGTRVFDAMARLITPRNVAGLADPSRRRLYPVDLDALVGSAELLGLSPDAITQALPQLRGFAETAYNPSRSTVDSG